MQAFVNGNPSLPIFLVLSVGSENSSTKSVMPAVRRNDFGIKNTYIYIYIYLYIFLLFYILFIIFI